MVEEKVKAVTKDLEEVKPKVAAFSELEKKIKKKFREISDTTELSKKILDKARNKDNFFIMRVCILFWPNSLI